MLTKSYISFVLIFTTIHALKNVEFSSNGKGTFINIIEKGVVVAGKSNIIFSVKACQSAAFVLSDIIGIANSTGRYFIIMYGTAGNKIVMAYDSCFSCSLSKKVEKEVLACDEYKSFWVRWDKKGNVDTGSGTSIGANTLLALDGFYTDYNINTAAVTSTGGVVAQWRFTATETTTEFFSPSPSGTTKVEVYENVTVGFNVLNFTIKPPDDEVTYSLTGGGADYFLIENSSLVVGKVLDYEKERFLTLTIGTNIGVSTSMTVVVKNVFDERPVINVTGVILIPEELPVGTVIWWNRTITDPDANDSLTYTLNGPLSELVTVTPSGDINVTQRIDREALNSSMIDTNARLTVTDSGGLRAEQDVHILITDVNDNSPTFNRTLFEVEMIQNATNDVAVANLDFFDKDEGENGRVSVSIYSKDNSSFYVNQSVLYVKANSLDLGTSTSRYKTLTIEASDHPTTGGSRTATAVVFIKFPPRDQHKPEWTYPALKSKTTFQDVEISSSSPPGALVTVFRVRDGGEGGAPLFSLQTLGSEGSIFRVDSETGELRTKDVLKKDSYTLTVAATVGKRTINGTITVNIKEDRNSDTTPVFKFSRPIFIIQEPRKKDIGRTLLVVRVLNRGNASRVRIIMDEKGSKAFYLEPIGEKWKLMLREDFYNQSQVSLPTVVILSAFAHGTSQMASAYIVVDAQIIQHQPRPSSTPSTTSQGHNFTTHTTTRTPEATTLPPTSTSTTTTTEISAKHTECTTTGLGPVAVLSFITAVQGATLIGLLTYMYAARHKRKRNNSVEPERSEPVGCELDKKLSSEKGGSNSATTSKEQFDSDSTVLEIVDETTSNDLKDGHEAKEKANGSFNGTASGDENRNEERESRTQSKNEHGRNEENDEVEVAKDHADAELSVAEKRQKSSLENKKKNHEESGKDDNESVKEEKSKPMKETSDDSNDFSRTTKASHNAKTKVESDDDLFDDDFQEKTVRKEKDGSQVKTEKDFVKDDDGDDDDNMSSRKQIHASDEGKGYIKRVTQESRVEKDLDSIFNDKNSYIDDDDFFGLSQNTKISETKSVYKSKPNTPKNVDFFDDFDDNNPDKTRSSFARTPYHGVQDFDSSLSKVAEHNNTAQTETERNVQPEKTSPLRKRVDDEYMQKNTLKHNYTHSPSHPGNTSPASPMTDPDELLTRKQDRVIGKHTSKFNSDPSSSLIDKSVYNNNPCKSSKPPKLRDVFEPVTAVGVTSKSKARDAVESDGSDSAEDSDDDSEEEDQTEHTAVVTEQRDKPSTKSQGKKSSKHDPVAERTACAVEDEPTSKRGKRKKKGRKKQNAEKKSKSKPKNGGAKKSSKKHKKK